MYQKPWGPWRARFDAGCAVSGCSNKSVAEVFEEGKSNLLLCPEHLQSSERKPLYKWVAIRMGTYSVKLYDGDHALAEWIAKITLTEERWAHIVQNRITRTEITQFLPDDQIMTSSIVYEGDCLDKQIAATPFQTEAIVGNPRGIR